MSNKLKSLLVFLVVVGIALGFSEWILREFNLVPKIESGWSWHNSPRRAAQGAIGDLQSNQLGYRGRKIEYSEEDYVILLVGDSQVEAANIPFEMMPEVILEKEINKTNKKVKVFSLGSSGWGQDQQLIALRDFLGKYRADMVLLWATPINDFWENSFPDRNTEVQAGPIKPTYALSGDNLKGPFYKDSFYLHGSALYQLIAQVFNGGKANDIVLNEWVQSMPVQNFEEAASCSGNVEIAQADFFEKIDSYNENNSYTIKTSEDFSRGRSHFFPYIYPLTDLEKYQINITKKLFEKIDAMLSHDNVIFRVFYPIRRDFDIKLRLANCVNSNGNYYKFVPNYRELLESVVPNNKLIKLALKGGDENSLAPNDRHLSPTGHERVFKSLAENLRELLM